MDVHFRSSIQFRLRVKPQPFPSVSKCRLRERAYAPEQKFEEFDAFLTRGTNFSLFKASEWRLISEPVTQFIWLNRVVNRDRKRWTLNVYLMKAGTIPDAHFFPTRFGPVWQDQEFRNGTGGRVNVRNNLRQTVP